MLIIDGCMKALRDHHNNIADKVDKDIGFQDVEPALNCERAQVRKCLYQKLLARSGAKALMARVVKKSIANINNPVRAELVEDE